ncbi:hypothetical protein Aperf_G00000060923 [Anoplocephala perfoliata]
MEELLQRHRKEKKELQAKITALKKSVPKGDRNKRNQVMQHIATLEKQLADHHEEELKELNSTLEACTISTLEQKPQAVCASTEADFGPRISKAAKRREKAAAKARILAQHVEQSLAKSATSVSAKEYSELDQALSERGLMMHKVPPDGDCLFASIAHQLEVLELRDCLTQACTDFSVKSPDPDDVKSVVRCLRLLAVAVIRRNADYFLPFICSESDVDSNSTEETVDLYCEKMEKLGTWGGQLEIQALSSALKHSIEVIQTVGPVIRTGEQFIDSSKPSSPLVITRS